MPNGVGSACLDKTAQDGNLRKAGSSPAGGSNLEVTMLEAYVVVEEMLPACGVLHVAYEDKQEADAIAAKIIAENGYARVLKIAVKPRSKGEK